MLPISYASYFKLCRCVPRQLRQDALGLYWKLFWQSELRAQRAVLGKEAAQDLRGSERATLVEAIASHFPFNSLLEVGAGYGQLFQIIAALFPSASFLGLDKDIARVEAANSELMNLGLLNAQLKFMEAKNLAQIPTGQFDLVCTSACLLYIEPEQIAEVLRELWRITKRALLLLEQEHEGQEELCPAVDGMPTYYRRSYREALSKALPEATIKVQKVRNPLWPTEDWKSSACLFELKKADS